MSTENLPATTDNLPVAYGAETGTLPPERVEAMFDRIARPYDDFQKWCREIVWWGNKKGAYLYSPNATAITPELAGHY